MQGIMIEDNLDADCRLSEGELDAFGRVHQMVETMASSRGNEPVDISVAEVMAELRKVGLGSMPLIIHISLSGREVRRASAPTGGTQTQRVLRDALAKTCAGDRCKGDRP